MKRERKPDSNSRALCLVPRPAAYGGEKKCVGSRNEGLETARTHAHHTHVQGFHVHTQTRAASHSVHRPIDTPFFMISFLGSIILKLRPNSARSVAEKTHLPSPLPPPFMHIWACFFSGNFIPCSYSIFLFF